MTGTSIGRQTIAVLAAQADLSAAFLEGCGAQAPKFEITMASGEDVSFLPVPTSVVAAGEFLADVQRADAIVLLVRFADRNTMDEIRAALGRLPAGAVRNLNVLLCRNPGEAEYKMSCPKCGQRLLIKDALAFQRITCPNCKKGFAVPGQTDLLHEQLMVPSMKTIRKVTLGDAATSLHALASLTWQVREIDEAAKSSTMRIDLPPGSA
jgi:predicted RNA-binding Zn-ribbon protein involved in translation (DUF1610 family)